MAPALSVAGRVIGPGAPVMIVAELSANHRQSYDLAVELLHAAHQAGADAVKLQTYTPETMTLPRGSGTHRLGAGTPWEGRDLAELYAEAYMPWEWQPRLAAEANRLGMLLFSSPFDATSVDFLEAMECPLYKVASFEVVDLPLLRRIAATGKPVIMSTGMATWEEIEEAVATLRNAGCQELALLKCVSSYPADPAEMNLRNIPLLAAAFGVPAGLSDHALGSEAALAAIALGACLIEKHLTLDRSAGGPDSSFSLEPHEFRVLVQSARIVEQALGAAAYQLSPREAVGRTLRRSLYAIEDIQAGEVIRAEQVGCLRPADGLAPRHLPRVVGSKAARRLAKGTPLNWDAIAEARTG